MSSCRWRNGGTLFLDEVGDIPLMTQVKLLRVLQEREFERVGGTQPVRIDIRIISATNQDLKHAIQEKTVREDFYYRLNVMPISLTPLRHRQEDIPLLVQAFIEKYSGRMKKQVEGISSTAMEVLLRFDWPGNVRELENTIERAVVLCDSDKIDLPHLISLSQNKEIDLLRTAVQQQMTEEQLTKLYAKMILNEQDGSKKRTSIAVDEMPSTCFFMRHPLSGRSWRHSFDDASQASACTAGAGVRARWRDPTCKNRYQNNFCH